MRKRSKTIGATVAALAALALGGSAVASATQGTPTPTTPAASIAPENANETGNVESGEQSSAGGNGADVSSGAPSQGQDNGSASESSSESTEAGSASENGSPSDGPGGHEDAAGITETQSESQE